MKLKAKLYLSEIDRRKLRAQLNMLHGFEDGLVPYEVDADDKHLEAHYRVARNYGKEFYVEVELTVAGELKILGISEE